jgi:prenylcysteine oxidase / farnesylcysteine lyase
VNITVLERTGRIGGRTLTVNAFNNPAFPVELGASIFIKLNHILWNASHNFNLSLKDPDFGDEAILGVWNGESFVYQQDDRSWNWWNLTKLFWKYGLAPYRTQKLMQTVIAKFLQLYEAPYFPFRSLTSRAYELELQYATGQTGQQFLAQNKVNASSMWL